MGCILNRVGSFLFTLGTAQSLPRPLRLKRLFISPLLLFFLVSSIPRCSPTGTIFNSLPKPIPRFPCFHARCRSLFSHLRFICLRYSAPYHPSFFLRSTENEGFLWREHLIKDFFETRTLALSNCTRFLSSCPPSRLTNLSLPFSSLFSVPFSSPCRSFLGLSIAGRTIHGKLWLRESRVRDTDYEGERFFDGCEYHRISVDWKFYRCKSRVYTVPRTNQQSYRVNRFRIKIGEDGGEGRKKVSQLLLRYFSISEKCFRLIGRILVIAFNALYAQNPRIRWSARQALLTREIVGSHDVRDYDKPSQRRETNDVLTAY